MPAFRATGLHHLAELTQAPEQAGRMSPVFGRDKIHIIFRYLILISFRENPDFPQRQYPVDIGMTL
jgi:hypothetical protein